MSKTPTEQLSMMLVLATTEFAGKVDKAGRPYILHCLKVMHYLKSDDDELNTIALGHDLIEDRGKTVTYQLLREMGFSERVIEGIRCMTKMPGEAYSEYKTKVKSNIDSIRVKKADVRHNSDIRRLKGVTERDIQRTIGYHHLHLELVEAEKNWIFP